MAERFDLRHASAAIFEPTLGTEFRSQDPDAVLVLSRVQRFPVQPHAPRTEPFALTFTGPPGLEQRIYRLEHPVLGRFDVFLVPIGPGTDGQLRYEAVFN